MDSTRDPEQEHMYFLQSDTIPSTCYILPEYNIHFNSMSEVLLNEWSDCQVMQCRWALIKKQKNTF